MQLNQSSDAPLSIETFPTVLTTTSNGTIVIINSTNSSREVARPSGTNVLGTEPQARRVDGGPEASSSAIAGES